MPPGPSLSWYGDVGGRDVLGDALAHPLHAVDEVLPRGARPDLRLDGAHVGLAERGDPPRSGRAFSSAWNSQLFAQRS